MFVLEQLTSLMFLSVCNRTTGPVLTPDCMQARERGLLLPASPLMLMHCDVSSSPTSRWAFYFASCASACSRKIPVEECTLWFCWLHALLRPRYVLKRVWLHDFHKPEQAGLPGSSTPPVKPIVKAVCLKNARPRVPQRSDAQSM